MATMINYQTGLIEFEGWASRGGRRVGFKLIQSIPNKKYKNIVNIEVTDLTGPEVQQLRYAVDKTLAEAERVAFELDVEAREDFDNGHDPDPRLHRTLGRLYEAQQQQPGNDSGVHG